MDILGVDVGKHEMHAVLLQQDRSSSKSVANSATGFKQWQSWLRNRKVERVHACLEATGGWSEDLALALYEAGYIVSLVNPMRIKAFAKSEMLRTKTVRRSRRCAIISGGTGRVKCPEVTEANAFYLLSDRVELPNELLAFLDGALAHLRWYQYIPRAEQLSASAGAVGAEQGSHSDEGPCERC
jgi:transposase